MAVEFDGGVVIGADSRTTTGCVHVNLFIIVRIVTNVYVIVIGVRIHLHSDRILITIQG